MIMCHKCRVSAGYIRKDDGSHTAVIKCCQVCGELKPVLDDRHWVKKVYEK